MIIIIATLSGLMKPFNGAPHVENTVGKNLVLHSLM
jgi:hypothetical protein